MSPENEVKLSQNFKVVIEMKKGPKESPKDGLEKREFYISGLTKERVVLEQDIWASQVSLIEKITCFMKSDGKWKEYEISEFFIGKKNSDNSGKKKDRMVKSFSFGFCNAEIKTRFENDFSELNP